MIKYSPIFAVASVLISLIICSMIGGVMLTAYAVTAGVYFGTMMTMYRIEKPSLIQKRIETGHWMKQVYLRPYQALGYVKEWLFKNELAMTLVLGAFAAYTANIATVTGIVCFGISSVMGDAFVTSFNVVAEFTENIGEIKPVIPGA